MPELRVLIVDDESLVRDTLRTVLGKFGHTAVGVSDGAKALAELQAHPFDLIITDLLMPDFDGLELLTRLRRTHPAIPVIAISGGGRISGNDYLRMAKKLGAVAVLSKPFTPDDVAAAIRSAFPPPPAG
ncbi:MAG: response regulator [Opitutaceae bacterium]